MKAITLGLFVVGCILSIEARNVTYCLADDTEPYLAYATKTSYDYIQSLRTVINSRDIPNCKPVQIWVLFRHGTRYPGMPDIDNLKALQSIRDQIVLNHESRFNGNLCDKDLNNFKDWRYSIDASQSDKLAPQGHADLLYIGYRMKALFPGILNISYSQDKFVMKHTDTERTQRSAEAFAEGLFGKDSNVVIDSSSVDQDLSLLRPYSNCSAWSMRTDDYKAEMHAFEQSDTMKSVMAEVSKRLGFLYNLSLTDVELMYDMCRFDKAWNYSKTSPWCAAFTKEHLQVLEYTEDLKYYYKSSYGSDINAKLACPLLKDMYTKFSKTAENSSDNSNPIGTFYFSHASMLNMFNARLGMAKDPVPPTHTNYYTQAKREYRTSLLMPFATNIAAVFYKCTSGEENQVVFYRNEKVIPYEGCSVGLCSWNMIKEKFGPSMDPATCNVDFCKWNSAGAIPNPTLLLLFAAVAILVFRF